MLAIAFNHVTQVGVQFCYVTSESSSPNAAKTIVFIGSEVLTTVNSSTFTACTINGQALGTSMTKSGIIGVRIRPTAVSSGNLYDLNNGFAVEQPYLNLGSTATVWARKNTSVAQELNACLRYYEKTYDLATAPGTSSTTAGGVIYTSSTALGLGNVIGFPFKVMKRVQGTGTFYSPSTGTSGQIRDNTGAADAATTAGNIGHSGMSASVSLSANHIYQAHWTLDAEI